MFDTIKYYSRVINSDGFSCRCRDVVKLVIPLVSFHSRFLNPTVSFQHRTEKEPKWKTEKHAPRANGSGRKRQRKQTGHKQRRRTTFTTCFGRFFYNPISVNSFVCVVFIQEDYFRAELDQYGTIESSRTWRTAFRSKAIPSSIGDRRGIRCDFLLSVFVLFDRKQLLLRLIFS